MIRQSSIDEVAALAEWDRRQAEKRQSEALITRATGRSLYLRECGEEKTPDIIDSLIRRIRQLESTT